MAAGTGAPDYSPDPDHSGDVPVPPRRGWKMNSRERLTTSMAGPFGTSFFTPDQQDFRDNVARGRWPADPAIGAHAPVNAIRQDPDSGAVDVVKLEPTYNPDGTDAYLDLNGQGAIDVAAGRP